MAISHMARSVLWPSYWKWLQLPWMYNPTVPFAILEPQDQQIDNCFVVQEHHVTDSKAPKLWKGRSGSSASGGGGTSYCVYCTYTTLLYIVYGNNIPIMRDHCRSLRKGNKNYITICQLMPATRRCIVRTSTKYFFLLELFRICSRYGAIFSSFFPGWLKILCDVRMYYTWKSCFCLILLTLLTPIIYVWFCIQSRSIKD